MIDNVLVKVCVEQGLQSEHGITHGTLVDHPERDKKALIKKKPQQVHNERLHYLQRKIMETSLNPCS